MLLRCQTALLGCSPVRVRSRLPQRRIIAAQAASAAATRTKQFVYAGHSDSTDLKPDSTVFVDGYQEGFRCLTHWPYAKEDLPDAIKHDLSTGIALNYIGCSDDAQRAFLGSFDTVTNNHYDTDGALAAFALCRPDLAVPRRDAMLRAAAVGDFCYWEGEDALAVDLTIDALPSSPHSPIASQLASCSTDDERSAAAYEWLLQNLASVLDNPHRYENMWRDDYATICADIERVRAGDTVEVTNMRDVDMDVTVVVSHAPITIYGVIEAAQRRNRILLVRPCAPHGNRYRFFYNAETWFKMASGPYPQRKDLTQAAAALNASERRQGGGKGWWTTPLSYPTAGMGFGSEPGKWDIGKGVLDIENYPCSSLPLARVQGELFGVFGTF